ncbi:G-type lectin S-receptor-like serine/threonine-protein kinase RKS1 [Morella rubra]|uniref:G-type lectin S-receptor-like serine/threonine-protein kinase RKS1 n=1 Tax=Morella rubra TaxID=262757 RepID=A0A6A1UH68_9ROSI|nr:G-type lectin S-receptor-like serine/threonine-protein kinase RKS1 [Morella rubra]
MLSKRLKSFPVKAMCSAKELFTSLFLLSLVFRYTVSADTVTPNQPIKNGDILISTDKTFALGFFSPRFPFWSTNTSVSSMNNSMARLLDSGNLVLVGRDSQRVTWQSFDYPSNTMLPFMKLGLDRRTGFKWYLTSWKSAENPGTGNCSYAIDPSEYPQLFLYKAGAPFWWAGSWTEQRWSCVPEMTRNFIFNVSYVNNQDEIAITYAQYAKKHSLIRNKGILAVLTVSVAVLLLLGVSTVYWLVMKKKKGKRQSKHTFNVDSSSTYFEESTSGQEMDGSTGKSDLPFFDLSTIVAATDHFSVANKLGEGGFGSVYKEIAIKRLLKHSGQAIEEFKNEVAIIAKLQHKNLVRILGYCVQGEEKMLIYEYLPNKSLDSFIFEYAMQGLFSVKSDVYSFGVLLLEIITGKKNSTFYHDGPSSNLIGHVWDLWREGEAMEIVDSSLGEKYPANEVSRCIQIGLLCVQEHATDRPTMSAVVFMLGNDTPLPSPKQPAFILKSTYNSKDASTSEGAFSANEITVSMIHGR